MKQIRRFFIVAALSLAEPAMAEQSNLWQAVKICTSHKLTASAEYDNNRFERKYDEVCNAVYYVFYGAHLDGRDQARGDEDMNVIYRGLRNPVDSASDDEIEAIDKKVLIRMCTSTPGRPAPNIPSCQKLHVTD